MQRTFYDYIARVAPYCPDDGTISPWVCITSLPFAPKIVLRAIRTVMGIIILLFGKNKGFQASFNASFQKKGDNPFGWLSPWQFGLNRGPGVIMIENYLSGHTWKIFKHCPHIISGLRKTGFKGGWLVGVK